jgi:hypothetical protein
MGDGGDFRLDAEVDYAAFDGDGDAGEIFSAMSDDRWAILRFYRGPKTGS